MKNKKKIIIGIGIFVLLFILSSCGGKKETYIMDQLAADGYYHYSNSDLGFTILFPAEFIYYQTQRVTTDSFTDIEFFVPTNDLSYPKTVPGYARSVTVRLYSDYSWNKIENKNEILDNFENMGKGENGIYLLKFWERRPDDWREKWTEEMKNNIRSSFKIN